MISFSKKETVEEDEKMISQSFSVNSSLSVETEFWKKKGEGLDWGVIWEEEDKMVFSYWEISLEILKISSEDQT